MRRFPWDFADLALVGVIIVLLFLSQSTFGETPTRSVLSEDLLHPALLHGCLKENIEGQLGGSLTVDGFSGPYFPKTLQGVADRTRTEYEVLANQKNKAHRLRLLFVARLGKQWNQFLYGANLEYIGAYADAMEATAEVLPWESVGPKRLLDLLPCWKYFGHSNDLSGSPL